MVFFGAAFTISLRDSSSLSVLNQYRTLRRRFSVASILIVVTQHDNSYMFVQPAINESSFGTYLFSQPRLWLAELILQGGQLKKKTEKERNEDSLWHITLCKSFNFYFIYVRAAIVYDCTNTSFDWFKSLVPLFRPMKTEGKACLDLHAFFHVTYSRDLHAFYHASLYVSLLRDLIVQIRWNCCIW